MTGTRADSSGAPAGPGKTGFRGRPRRRAAPAARWWTWVRAGVTLLAVACGGEGADAPPAGGGGGVDSASFVDTVIPGDSAVAAPGEATVDSLRREIAALRARLPASAESQPAGASADPDASEILQGAARNVRFLGVRAFWALVVLLMAYYAIRFSVYVLDQVAERITTRRLFIKRLAPMVRLSVWAFAVYYVIAGVFQVDRTSLLAATAAIGVAIGLAAQDVLKNIFGGLIIILDRPFQVGDKIRVGGTYGEVVSIGLRATRIVTPDDNLVSVPNLKVVEGDVANANAGALDCQVVVDLFLPGWIDVAEAKRIAYDAAATSRFAFLDKPIVVNVKDEFRETFLTHLVVKVYVLDTRYEFALASDITETAKEEYRRRGMLPALSGVQVSSGAAAGGAG